METFISKTAKDFILRCLKENRCLTCIDQSASIKNSKAKRTKFLLKQVSPLSKYRRILDGAPVAEGAHELYSQFAFLDKNIIGHDTWTSFKCEYCKIGRFNEILGYRNLDDLMKKTAPYSFRVLAKDCLDLPAITYKHWNFDLSKEERVIFDNLKKMNFTYFLNDPEVKSYEKDLTKEDAPVLEESLAMVKNLRLQQISSGWFFDKEKNVLFPIAQKFSSRLETLLLLLEKAKGKVLIFSRFKSDILLLKKALGTRQAVFYHGDVSKDDRAEAIKKFMNDPQTLYFVGQPRTAGIGHTLTSAKHIIFYTNDPSLRFREECEKRVHRKGLEKTLEKGEKLIVWDLVARRTQDNKVITALKNKKKISNLIMQDPEGFFMETD